MACNLDAFDRHGCNAFVACCVDDTFGKWSLCQNAWLLDLAKFLVRGAQCVVPIGGTRKRCLNMIGGAMSQSCHSIFLAKTLVNFLATF